MIYLPESYNSLSTCIHTLSLVFLARTPPPFPPCSDRLPHSGSFSSPLPLPLPLPALFSSSCRLRPYQLYLNFSPYPPPSAMRLAGYFPFALSARPFRMAVHAHNFRAPLPVTYVAAFTQPRVQSILSSTGSFFGAACTRALLVLYLNVYMLIYARVCMRRTLTFRTVYFRNVEFTVAIYFSIFLEHQIVFFWPVIYSISRR